MHFIEKLSFWINVFAFPSQPSMPSLPSLPPPRALPRDVAIKCANTLISSLYCN